MTLLRTDSLPPTYVQDDRRTVLRTWTAVLALLCINLLALWQLAGAGWLWHDQARIADDISLRSVSGLAATWLHPLAAQSEQPLAQTLYWLEHHFFGSDDSIGFRCVSALLQTCTAVLLWRVMTRLLVPYSWSIAAVYAMHPTAASAGALVVNQPALLAGVFSLLATLLYLRVSGVDPLDERADEQVELPLIRFRLPRSPVILWALAVVLFALSALSDSNSWVFPLIWICLSWWKCGRVAISQAAICLLLAVAAFAFALAGWMTHSTVSLPFHPDPLHRAMLLPLQFWIALKRTIWPGAAAFFEPRDLTSVPWFAIAATLLVPAVTLLGLLSRRWRKTPLAAFVLFILLLLPSVISTRLTASEAAVTDVDRYLAIVVPLALIINGISRLYRRFVLADVDLSDIEDTHINWHRRATVITSTVGMGVFGVIGLLRLNGFQDEVAVWKQAQQNHPASALVGNELGLALINHNRTEAGELQLKQVLANHPDNVDTLTHLARYYTSQKQWAEGIALYDRAMRLRPGDPALIDAKAELHTSRGEIDVAIALSNQALQLDPRDVLAHNNLGVLLAAKGDLDAALSHYRKALEIQPNSTAARVNLANALYRKHDLDGAAGVLLEVIDLDPENYEAYNAAGIILSELGRHDGAAGLFGRAIQYRPDSAEAYYNLGAELEVQGEKQQAKFMYAHALRLKPDFPQARQNLARVEKSLQAPTPSTNLSKN